MGAGIDTTGFTDFENLDVPLNLSIQEITL
jgi:hypothetical protein